jgi:hypothetical protein
VQFLASKLGCAWLQRLPLIILIPFLLLIIGGVFVQQALVPGEAGIAQLLAVPFVALIIAWFFKKNFEGYPLFLKCAQAILASLLLMAVCSAGNEQLLAHYTHSVARFANDPLGGETRSFVDAVKRWDSSGLELSRLHRIISSAADAQAWLIKNSSYTDSVQDTLVWGSAKHMVLEFPLVKPTSLNLGMPYLVGDSVGDLELIEEIPRVLLSPDDGKHAYLYFLHLLLARQFEKGRSGHLVSAGAVPGAWRSSAHISYTFWRLGNEHIRFALQGAHYQPALLECALAYYVTALRKMSAKDNPILWIAIKNNQAVALFLTGFYQAAPRFVQVAKSHLVAAKKMQKKLYKDIQLRNDKINPAGDRKFLGNAITKNTRNILEFEVWNELVLAPIKGQ